MSGQLRNTSQVHGEPSFLEELYKGRFRWDLIHPFPVQDEADRAAGDQAIAELFRLLAEWIDPHSVEPATKLPAGLLAELRTREHLKARLAPDLGGLGFSSLNTFRMVQATAGWSVPAAMVVAAENAFGVGALLPQLRPGGLRDLLAARVRAGTISGMADTEPGGASNLRRSTTAVLTEDRGGYLLNAEKLFVSNAPIADLLIISATVREAGGEHRRLFVVDTQSPGVRVTPQEFMGLDGFPAGTVTCSNVWVPYDHMVGTAGDSETRITAEAAAMARIGRVFFTVAPALGIARQCLEWGREFVAAREVDGRPLEDYEEIQRCVVESAADLFAVEATAEWTLLGHDADGVNTRFEQNSVKNIATDACRRVVERTMLLLAGEGYETAASKRARGAPRHSPAERALRDLWAFRIAGGVDFQLDNFISRLFVFSYYYPAVAEPIGEVSVERSGGLSAPNRGHLQDVAAEVGEFGRTCRELSKRFPDPAALYRQERLLITISRLARELCTAALALARAARRSESGDDMAQELADVYCGEAMLRVSGLRRQIAKPTSEVE
jgi:alkylation response protein AidB-like acyl-CoA dehydrogenase